MGFTISWIGQRDRSEEELLASQGVAIDPAGTYGSLYRADEWHVVMSSPLEYDPAMLAALSRGCEVVTVQANDTAMWSELQSWTNGNRDWTISHFAEDGPTNLVVDGELSPIFAQSVDRLRQSLADYHYYGLAFSLADQMTGFQHNSDLINHFDTVRVELTGNPPVLPEPPVGEAAPTAGDSPDKPKGLLGRLLGR
jgi:hypothetical protein